MSDGGRKWGTDYFRSARSNIVEWKCHVTFHAIKRVSRPTVPS